MQIKDIQGISKEEMLEAIAAHRTIKKKKPPSEAEAMKVAGNVVKAYLIEKLTSPVRHIVDTLYTEYEMFNGEPEFADEDWSQGLDDMSERVAETYEMFLSQDWLGRFTIECGWADQEGREKWVEALGTEVYKYITAEMTQNKILSAAGIVKEDVLGLLQSSIPNNEGNDVEDNSIIEQAAQEVHEHNNAMPEAELHAEAKMLVCAEPAFADPAAKRIGISTETMDLIVGEYEGFMSEQDFADALVAAYQVAGKPKRTAGGGRGAQTPVPDQIPLDGSVSGAVPPEALVFLREFGGVKDNEMGEALGMSRATYNNYVKGKKGKKECHLEPTDEQRGVLVTTTKYRINKLLEVLGTLDGQTYGQM